MILVVILAIVLRRGSSKFTAEEDVDVATAAAKVRNASAGVEALSLVVTCSILRRSQQPQDMRC